MAASYDYDVVVLGGGPAGASVVSICSWLKKRTCVIEPRGMIWAAPTGAVSKIHRACGKIHGDACGRKRVPWHLVNKHLTDTLDRVAKLPLPHEGGKHGDTADGTETKSGEYATIVKGYARMLDEHTVGVSACCGLDEPLTHTVTGAVIIVATGSVASHLPGTPFDNKYVFDSDTIKDLGRTPRRLVIQGGGIIGIEYAFIMRQLGAEVLVVEYMPDMLTSLDSTLRKAILARLARCGVRVVLHATVKFVRVPSSDPSSGDVVELLVEPRSAAGEADLPPAAEYCWKGCEPSSPASTISSPLVVRCDAFMAATGRVGNTSTLDLACVGIKTDRYGRIPVQPRSMWSGVENIYAVGDVSGPSVFLPHGLVTTGQAQGIRAVYSAFINEWPSSHLRAEYYDHIPVAMWLSPDVAFVGLTEEDAVERYGRRHVACSIGLYSSTLKHCVEPREGFVKLVYLIDGGTIVGAHMFGEDASEMVHYGALLVNCQHTVFEVVKEVMAGVTYQQAYRTAGLMASKRVTEHAHKLKFGRSRM